MLLPFDFEKSVREFREGSLFNPDDFGLEDFANLEYGTPIEISTSCAPYGDGFAKQCRIGFYLGFDEDAIMLTRNMRHIDELSLTIRGPKIIRIPLEDFKHVEEIKNLELVELSDLSEDSKECAKKNRRRRNEI